MINDLDIRLSCSFFESLKIQKLESSLGPNGLLCLLKMWVYTARQKPDGFLSDMTLDDVELISKWNGESGKFASTLLNLNLLHEVEGGLMIHGWEEHQPWIANAPARKVAAKNAAKAKWSKFGQGKHDAGRRKAQCGTDAERMRGACGAHAGRMQGAEKRNAEGNAPSPFPSLPIDIAANAAIDKKPTVYGMVWEFITSARPEGLGLSQQEAALACKLLRKGDWTAYGLGCLWFCVENPPDPPPQSIAIFAKGCMKGRTMALERAEVYEKRAAAKLAWFEREVQETTGDFGGYTEFEAV